MSINQQKTEDTREAARRYVRAGFAVILVPPGEKNPGRRGWQRERWTLEGALEGPRRRALQARRRRVTTTSSGRFVTRAASCAFQNH